MPQDARTSVDKHVAVIRRTRVCFPFQNHLRAHCVGLSGRHNVIDPQRLQQRLHAFKIGVIQPNEPAFQHLQCVLIVRGLRSGRRGRRTSQFQMRFHLIVMHFCNSFQALPLVQKLAFFIRGFPVEYEYRHNSAQLKHAHHAVHVFKQRLVGCKTIHVDAGIHDNHLAHQVGQWYCFYCARALPGHKLVQMFDAHRSVRCNSVVDWFSETIQINFSLNLNITIYSVVLSNVMRMLEPEGFMFSCGTSGHRALQWCSSSMKLLKLDRLVRNCMTLALGFLAVVGLFL